MDGRNAVTSRKLSTGNVNSYQRLEERGKQVRVDMTRLQLACEIEPQVDDNAKLRYVDVLSVANKTLTSPCEKTISVTSLMMGSKPA
jgi:hypothetical protein